VSAISRKRVWSSVQVQAEGIGPQLVTTTLSRISREVPIAYSTLYPIGVVRFSGADGSLGLGIAYVSRYQSSSYDFCQVSLHCIPPIPVEMRWLFSSALVLAWTAVASAKSFTGNRLLVVLEEQSEKEKYSVFLEDLACKLQSRRLVIAKMGIVVSPLIWITVGWFRFNSDGAT
jgi:hypothetical protein